MYASIASKKEEIDFCVCFTCQRGFVGDITTSQASRWLNGHEKEEGCKKEHRAAAMAFKLRREAALAAKGPIENLPPQSTPGSAMEVWNTLKTKRDYVDLCNEFEVNDKEYYDMDSDNDEEYVFDPAKGILKLFKDASEYKKSLCKITAAFSQVEADQSKKEEMLLTKIKELEESIDKIKQMNEISSDAHGCARARKDSINIFIE